MAKHADLDQLVDHVLPLLTPYQLSLYLFLLRHSAPVDGNRQVRIGKRTIAAGLGRGPRSSQGNYQHITEKLNELAELGFIRIGDTTREGTRYGLVPLDQVPTVRERLALVGEEVVAPPDYLRDKILRSELFERDNWQCRYCGTPVTSDTATLDHIVPTSKGGDDAPDNLATCCLLCNSIKAGESYDDAAPRLLAALRSQRLRTQ